jgi:RNA polymerase sigma-70 factor (ECF subfamily)
VTSLAPAARSRDVELAARCVQQERTAQKELFQLTRAAVHHTLFRILGSNQDMEDVLQETYLEVFRSIPRYAARSSLVTWCCAIAAHVALASLRSRRRPTVELSADLPANHPDAERTTLAREAAQRLYAALDRIDPTHRIAFALAVIDERPLQEVADLTDASLSAVKTRVWRARKELDRLASRDSVLAAYVGDLTANRPAKEDV